MLCFLGIGSIEGLKFFDSCQPGPFSRQLKVVYHTKSCLSKVTSVGQPVSKKGSKHHAVRQINPGLLALCLLWLMLLCSATFSEYVCLHFSILKVNSSVLVFLQMLCEHHMGNGL